MQKLNIASMPADGIGPEVVSVGIEVALAACERNSKLEVTGHDAG